MMRLKKAWLQEKTQKYKKYGTLNKDIAVQ